MEGVGASVCGSPRPLPQSPSSGTLLAAPQFANFWGFHPLASRKRQEGDRRARRRRWLARGWGGGDAPDLRGERYLPLRTDSPGGSGPPTSWVVSFLSHPALPGACVGHCPNPRSRELAGSGRAEPALEPCAPRKCRRICCFLSAAPQPCTAPRPPPRPAPPAPSFPADATSPIAFFFFWSWLLAGGVEGLQVLEEAGCGRGGRPAGRHRSAGAPSANSCGVRACCRAPHLRTGPRIPSGQPQAQKLLRNWANKRGHSAGGAKSPERHFAPRAPEPAGAPWTAGVGELAACCVSRSPCFPGPAGWEAGHIHPWTRFRKEAAAFSFGFSGFLKTQWPRRRRRRKEPIWGGM